MDGEDGFSVLSVWLSSFGEVNDAGHWLTLPSDRIHEKQEPGLANTTHQTYWFCLALNGWNWWQNKHSWNEMKIAGWYTAALYQLFVYADVMGDVCSILLIDH